MLQAYKNSKLLVELNEDVKTSSIIGELTHLQADLFWYLLRSATAYNESLPEIAGEIYTVEYWPKWSAEGCDITNNQFVEPDVFIRFQKFDIILEIKKNDGCGQYMTQWTNEICGYLNEYADDNKDIYIIALGGNNNMQKENIRKLRDNDLVVHKCSWFSLLEKVNEQMRSLYRLPYKDSCTMQTIRILQDIVSSFNLYGDYVMEGFDNFPKNLLLCNNYKIDDIWNI